MTALIGRGHGRRKLSLADREAEAVGGGEGDLIILDGEQHPGQDGAGFVGGGGKSHLLDHLFQIGHVDLDAVRQVGHRHGGEFLSIDAFEIGIGGAAAHV